MVSNTIQPIPGAVAILAANNRPSRDSTRVYKKKTGDGSNANANTLSDAYWKTRVIQFLREQNGSTTPNLIGKYLALQPPSSPSSSSSSDPSHAASSSLLAEIKASHGSLVAWLRGHAETFLLENVKESTFVVHLILEQSKKMEDVSIAHDDDDLRETEQPRRNGEKQNPSSSVVSRSTSLYWMKLVREFLLQNGSNTEASSGEVGSYLQSQPSSSQDARRAQSALEELKECHGNIASWVHLNTDELIWEQSSVYKSEFMIRLLKGRLQSETTSAAKSKLPSNSKTTAITNVESSREPKKAKTKTTTTITKSNTLSPQSSRDSYWKNFMVRFLARNQGAATMATGSTTREIGLYLNKLPSSDGRSPSALAEFKKEGPGLTSWLQQQPELFVVQLVGADFVVHLTEQGIKQALLDAVRSDIAEMKTRMPPHLPKKGESKKQSVATIEVPVKDQTHRELAKKERQSPQPQEDLSVLKATLEKAENERDDALKLVELAKRVHYDTMRTVASDKDEKERLQLLWGDTRNQLGREKEIHQNLRSELDGTIERLASTIISKEVLQNRLRSEQIVRKEVEAEVIKLMNQLLRKQDNGESSRLVRVRNELQLTQDKLAREKEKNRSAIFRTQEVREAKLPELSDWMGALDGPVRVMQISDVPMRVPDPTVTEPTLSSVPAPLEAPNCAAPESTTQDRGGKINFGGLDDSDDAEKDALDRLDAELTFVMSSYGGDELHATNSAVVRFLNLDMDQDSTVRVNLTLTFPEGYPASGTLDVKAEIDDASTSGSTEARKCVSDYLLFLVNVCQWEANVSLGNEALLTVLTAADRWVQNEWAGIRTKYLGEKSSRKDSEGVRTFEICRLLVYSHHIIEPEKIQLLKSLASKSGIGGIVRIGRPGFVLAEGLEENCDNFLASIVQQRKKQREKGTGKVDSAYFTQAGKVLTTVNEFGAGRSFSNKITQLEGADSLDELKQLCGRFGLAESLEEACKR